MTKTELASLASVRMTKIALASLATVGMRERDALKMRRMSGLVLGRRGRRFAHLGAFVIEHRPSLDQLDAESAMAADEIGRHRDQREKYFPRRFPPSSASSATDRSAKNEADEENLEHRRAVA